MPMQKERAAERLNCKARRAGREREMGGWGWGGGERGGGERSRLYQALSSRYWTKLNEIHKAASQWLPAASPALQKPHLHPQPPAKERRRAGTGGCTGGHCAHGALKVSLSLCVCVCVCSGGSHTSHCRSLCSVVMYSKCRLC